MAMAVSTFALADHAALELGDHRHGISVVVVAPLPQVGGLHQHRYAASGD